jgi:hypothetical protein
MGAPEPCGGTKPYCGHPDCRECLDSAREEVGWPKPAAAGPWRKWPEEKPPRQDNYLVEHTDDVGVWYIVSCISADTPFREGARVRWAEILP